ncbi:MAG: HU family DNA-binding protein [Alphaproteobacteria bacterium]|jgi:DNA-binding protein HU-beta|nr:HU family DNA-binding protein [Thalassospira sp.]MCE2965274.1 HU family DNA-binding protein [Alphaproteobacteria bacterium]
MNKNELISAISDQSGLSKADSTRALDATLEVISKTLKKGGDVRLVGFGTFLTTKRAATEGRNPRTGQKIKIAASVQPKFRPGKGLKDTVNKK